MSIKRDVLEELARTLREARERKGFSQRALAQRSGLRQSQVSNAENAAVDLQTSSLIELARALDLELTLIPRALVPAVKALQRETAPRSDSTSAQARPAYRLDDDETEDND